MARGQVQGGALQVREAHKSINPEGYPQRFRGDRESIPTAINIWIIGTNFSLNVSSEATFCVLGGF